MSHASAGKWDVALPLSEESVKLHQATFGSEHPSTLYAMTVLAEAYRAAKLPELAAAIHEQTLRIRRAKLGADDAHTISSINRLASTYLSAKKMDQAVSLYEEALQLIQAKHGPEHPDTLAAMETVANANHAAEKFDRWIAVYEELTKLRTKSLGPEHPDTLATKHKLAMHYRPAQGHYSIPMLEEVWNVRKRILPEGDKTRIHTQNELGQLLLYAGRFAESEPHLLTSYRDVLNSKEADPSVPLYYARRLLYLYAEWDKPAALAQWRAELKKLAGTDESRLGNSNSFPTLIQRSRFRAAEVVLRDYLALSEANRPDAWESHYARFMLGCRFSAKKMSPKPSR